MRSKPIWEIIEFTFGFGRPRFIISSCFLIIAFFFYIYVTISQINLGVYPLFNRVTYYTLFKVALTSQSVDYLVLLSSVLGWFLITSRNSWIKLAAVFVFGISIALTSIGFNNWIPDLIAILALPAILGLIIYNHITKKAVLDIDFKILATYSGLASIILAIDGLIISLGFILGMHDQALRNNGYEIYLIFFNFSPVLILIIVASLPIKFIMEQIRKTLTADRRDGNDQESKGSKRNKFLLLSSFILLSVLLNTIPHLQTVNKDGQLVGTDTKVYVEWEKALQGTSSPQEFFDSVFVKQGSGDRPLSLIFIHLIVGTTNQDMAADIEYIPFLLGPALVIAVYLLTREVTPDERIALLASFVTAVSFQTLTGIYAGFYANWLAIIVGYLCITFLLKFLKNPKRLTLTIFSGLTIALLFTHVYTWSVLTAVMVSFVVVSAFRRSFRKAAVMLLMVLVISVVIDLVRISFTESTGGFEADLKIAKTSTGLEQFTQRWNNLKYTSSTQVAGIFGNVVILGLGIYWLFNSKIQNTSSILMLIFFSLGLIPIIFGDWVVQTRILYNIPFQIPAAFALLHIKRRPGGNLWFIAICAWMLFLAVRTASNFYYVQPVQ